MRAVISALHFAWDNVPACLCRVRDEFGLDGVEVSWHRSFTRPHCTLADLDELRCRRGEHGLALSAHIWENLAQLGAASALEAVRFWLERGVETGVDTLILHGGSWDDQAEGIRRSRDILWALHPHLEAAGVRVCLENHYAFDYRGCHELFSQPWEFRDVLNPHHPSLRFCFDTGHAHMTRNGESLVRELAPYLSYVHLADNHGEHDDHCAFRQGCVPWDDYFTALAAAGFAGTFCVEFPVRDDLEPFRTCLRELRSRFTG